MAATVMTRLPTHPPANPASEVASKLSPTQAGRLMAMRAHPRAVEEQIIAERDYAVFRRRKLIKSIYSLPRDEDGYARRFFVLTDLGRQARAHLLSAPTCNESLQVADAEHLQGDTM